MTFRKLFILAGIWMLFPLPEARAEFLTGIGDRFPRFTVETVDGSEWSAVDEAPVTVLFVFDPESAVCQEFLPHCEYIANAARGTGGRAIGFVRGATVDEAKGLAREHGLTFPLVADPDAELAGWFAEDGKGVPRTIIADSEGLIAYQHGGYRLGREAEIARVARTLGKGEVISNLPIGDNANEDPNAMAADVVGKKAPEVHVEKWITEPPGDMEGKYVLTEFWATWCGPCVQVMPHLNDLAKEHEGKLVVQSISNEDSSAIASFVNKMGLTYPIGTDTQRRTADALRVRGIPFGYITNPEGVVVWQGHPAILEMKEGLLESILNGEKP